jgi:hypothetical protein
MAAAAGRASCRGGPVGGCSCVPSCVPTTTDTDGITDPGGAPAKTRGVHSALKGADGLPPSLPPGLPSSSASSGPKRPQGSSRGGSSSGGAGPSSAASDSGGAGPPSAASDSGGTGPCNAAASDSGGAGPSSAASDRRTDHMRSQIAAGRTRSFVGLVRTRAAWPSSPFALQPWLLGRPRTGPRAETPLADVAQSSSYIPPDNTASQSATPALAFPLPFLLYREYLSSSSGNSSSDASATGSQT